MKLDGAKALVTGGAVRIGRAIAEMLADAGCAVAVHYRQSASEARALVERLRERTHAVCVAGDLESPEACRHAVDEAWRLLDGFGILVHNASVFRKNTWETATESDLTQDWNVNFRAPALMTSRLAERLCPELLADDESRRERTSGALRGKVVCLLDRRISDADPSCVTYELSKKALADYVRQAAVAFAPWLAVNGVAPGAILPPRMVAAAETGEPARDLAGPTLVQAPCGPEDVASAVRFLLENDAVDGQTLFVDNGRHLLRGP